MTAKSNVREGDGVAELPAKWRERAGKEDAASDDPQFLDCVRENHAANAVMLTACADELEAAMQAQQGAEPVAWRYRHPKGDGGWHDWNYCAAPHKRYARSEYQPLYAARAEGVDVDDSELWCMHILGPDDVHPAPSKAVAQRAADWFNERFPQHPDITMRAVVAPWPHSPESHAESAGNFIAEWLTPQGQPVAPATGAPR